MEHFRSILAALDLGPRGDALTPGSLTAMRRAVWIASRGKASLTLLHSEKPDECWGAEAEAFVEGGGAEARQEYERHKRKMAVNHIERTLASTPMAGAAKLHVGLTSPTHAILESAEHLKPESSWS